MISLCVDPPARASSNPSDRRYGRGGELLRQQQLDPVLDRELLLLELDALGLLFAGQGEVGVDCSQRLLELLVPLSQRVYVRHGRDQG